MLFFLFQQILRFPQIYVFTEKKPETEQQQQNKTLSVREKMEMENERVLKGEIRGK